jgi:hypothetical protein
MTHDHIHPHGDHEHSHEHDHEHGHEHAPSPRSMPAEAVHSLHDYQAEKRAARRAMFASKDIDDIVEFNEDAWKARTSATDVIVAVTEELIARLVLEHFPKAHAIVLYEDTSHDAPHGHLEKIVDVEGNVLILGSSDEWHDFAWAQEADEYIWDLHHLDRDGFVFEEQKRRRHIPIKPQF